MIVLASGDLMVSSAAGGAAARTGVALQTVLAADELPTRCLALSPAAVILDLSLPGLDLGALLPRLRALAGAPRVLAFGPHVHETRLASARAAGCDLVLTRGQFHARMDELFRELDGATRG